MNRWQCEHPGCDTVADGTGPAAGLEAIGWSVTPRPSPTPYPLILCPNHRRAVSYVVCPFCGRKIDFEPTPSDATDGRVWICPGNAPAGHAIYDRESALAELQRGRAP